MDFFGKHEGQAGDILNRVDMQQQDTLKALQEVGINIATLRDILQEANAMKNDILYLNNYRTDFSTDGYHFNSLYVSDGAVADNAAIVVSYMGVVYTVDLVAGENIVNIPDGAAIQAKTTSGNGFTAILSKYNATRR